jgi:probable rRNA maturation factor
MAEADPRRRAGALRVLVTDEQGRRLSASSLSGWLRGVAPARARGVVTIALVSDDEVRRLNRAYRGLDRPTDVLSFPAADAGALRRSEPQPPWFTSGPFLGDIVIARGVARRQAREACHSELSELRVLALHGLLHLLGYDHERDRGQMRRVEERLRRKGGLRNGLIGRRSGPAPAPRPLGLRALPVLVRPARGGAKGAARRAGPRAPK